MSKEIKIPSWMLGPGKKVPDDVREKDMPDTAHIAQGQSRRGPDAQVQSAGGRTTAPTPKPRGR